VTSHSQALAGLLAATTYHYRSQHECLGRTGNIGRFHLYDACCTGSRHLHVLAGSITSSGATITWSTDQASSSQVEYGTTTGYGSMTTVDPTLVTSHSQALTGLLAATTYPLPHPHYECREYSGNIGRFHVHELAVPAPVISNVVTGSLTLSGATITLEYGSGIEQPD